MTKKLHGVTILVPESRELDLFAGMLEAHGARTLRCPLVTILQVAAVAIGGALSKPDELQNLGWELTSYRRLGL